MTRQECDEWLLKALADLPQDKETQQRMVRSLLRAAAALEIKLGHTVETMVSLAARAGVDVKNEVAAKKEMS